MKDEGRRTLIGSMAGIGLLAALPSKSQETSMGQTVTEASIAPSDSRPDRPAPKARTSPQSTSSGLTMRRDSTDSSIFDSLKSQYLQSYSSLIEPLRNDTKYEFRQITVGLVYKSQPLDEAFNPFHVETLLDQASNILDRAIRDRSQYEAIAAEYFSLMTELGEYLALDEIHKEEDAAGIYDVDWTTAVSELNAEYEIRDLNFLCKSGSDWTYTAQFSQQAMDGYSAASQCAAFISGAVPYSYKDQEFAGYVKHTWNGATRYAYEHLKISAFTTSWHYLKTQEWTVYCAKETYEGQWKSSLQRLKGLENKAAWEGSKRDFQRRRTLVARHVQDARLKAAVSPDGVLNSSRRLPAIKRRFEQDFNNALGRLKAASQGMEILFGYKTPLPNDTQSIDFFDDCLQWTRSSTDWLIRFARLEQSYVHVVSLRDILGKSAFKEGRSNRKWKIHIGHVSFPGMSHVRLRGVSVFVDDALIKRTWRFKLQAPEKSEIKISGGATRMLNQSVIRPVIVGRAAEYGSAREPDINGTSSLLNASPIGEWEIELWGETPSAENLSGLDDIILHLITSYTSE